ILLSAAVFPSKRLRQLRWLVAASSGCSDSHPLTNQAGTLVPVEKLFAISATGIGDVCGTQLFCLLLYVAWEPPRAQLRLKMCNNLKNSNLHWTIKTSGGIWL